MSQTDVKPSKRLRPPSKVTPHLNTSNTPELLQPAYLWKSGVRTLLLLTKTLLCREKADSIATKKLEARQKLEASVARLIKLAKRKYG